MSRHTLTSMLAMATVLALHGTSMATDGTMPPSGINISSAPSVQSCPVGSCPPADSPQLTYSLLQAYGETSKDANWEIGAVIGLLDKTGGGKGQVNDHTDAAKMGAYIGLLQTANGGPGWALNTNIVRNSMPGGENSLPGYAGAGTPDKPGSMAMNSSTIGYELDVSNFDQDSNGLPPDSPFVVGEYLTTTSLYTSWAGLFYGIGENQKVPAWHDGILFSSPNAVDGRTVSDNTIWDLSNSDVGYHSQGKHKTAGWYDESSGQYGLWLTGTKDIEDIDITSGTPVGIAINGTRSSAAVHLNISPSGGANSGIVDTGSHGQGQSYDDQSTGAVGIKAEGTYSYSAFSAQQAHTKIAFTAAPDQEICFNNSNNCVEWDGNTLVYSVGDRRLFAIDRDGNLSIRGSITQHGSP